MEKMDKIYQEVFVEEDIHKAEKLTPMMKQYRDIKSRYEDSILLFRMGDFYEVFFDDAVLLSNIIGLTLTKRAGIPMAGVPHHSLDTYLSKLIKLKKKVAICEQVEDPKTAKGIVKREVTQVITPGTIVENKYLDSKTNNYFLSFVISKNELSVAVAVCDISTGDFSLTNIESDSKENLIVQLLEEINRFSPKEIMTTDIISEHDILKKIKKIYSNIYYSTVANFTAEYTFAYDTLKKHFNTISLKGIGLEDNLLAVSLSGSMIYYISELSKASLEHINAIQLYNRKDTMNLDISTRENLEILSSIRNDDSSITLFDTIDRTITSMGSRYLKRIIVEPLVNVNEINDRLNNVEYFYIDYNLNKDIREILSQIGDIERLSSKLSLKRINAKELVLLKKCLLNSIKCITILATNGFELANIDEVEDIRNVLDLIEQSILDEPKTMLNEGDIIKETYNETLKKYNEARREGRNWISDLESKYKYDTGLNNLKIRYNNVIGYYIESTRSNASSIPKNFIKRQTLINNERYTTEALMEYEITINEANEKGYTLEFEIFCNVRDKVSEYINPILKIANIIAKIDVYSALGFLATEKDYIKPEVNDNDIIDIKEGRHPVVEQNLENSVFIPNDIYLNKTSEHLLIITGPNMSGKSTYLRQTALIVLLAQIGSFVPASHAIIGVVDRIFTRVGASDNIARGESTFLVEMNETAYILNNATNKSLIIMDEIGRGTSTYDGLSIAWSIIEHLSKDELNKAKTLFATHYHELTMLESIEGIKNYSVSVEEHKDNIIFMKRVVEGAAKSSYGIYAAQIAGIPKSITQRAKEILKQLEEYGSVEVNNIEYNMQDNKPKSIQNIETDANLKLIEDDIKNLDINSITPVEALNLISKWKILL